MGVEVHWMVHVGPNTCGIVLFLLPGSLTVMYKGQYGL